LYLIYSSLFIRGKAWKVADFGFTTKLQSPSSLVSRDGRGTNGYYPPEFLEEIGDLKYNTSLDIWQMRCILFEFAAGNRVFRTNFDTQKFRDGRTMLDIDLDDYFGQECKEEIRRCLTWILHVEPNQRPTAGQLVSGFQGHLQRANRLLSNSQTNVRLSFLPPTSAHHGIASNLSPNIQSPVFDLSSISATSPGEPSAYNSSIVGSVPLSTLGQFVSDSTNNIPPTGQRISDHSADPPSLAPLSITQSMSPMSNPNSQYVLTTQP
jgi:serine/threonine protein kinase